MKKSNRHLRTVPRNLTVFGERFILPIIRRFPAENGLFKLSELSGMCEPLCRKITTRPDPSINQIRHLIWMCYAISETSSDFEKHIVEALRDIPDYDIAHEKLYRRDMKRIRGEQ